MFHYHQNTELSHIGQQEQLAKAENERLASQTEQPQSFYGMAMTYLVNKLSALGHRLEEHHQQELPQTATSDPAAQH